MSHTFGAGVGTVPYDSYANSSFTSNIDLDVNDTSDSNRFVYISGSFDVSIDGNQYLSFQFLDSSGNVINSRYSSRVSRTTSRFNSTNGSNVVSGGYWNIGTSNNSNILYSEQGELQIYMDMNRSGGTAPSRTNVSGYWTSFYEDISGRAMGSSGSFALVSNTIITAVRIYSNGPGTSTIRGNCRSQVILGRY